jgi:hypothetical protein
MAKNTGGEGIKDPNAKRETKVGNTVNNDNSAVVEAAAAKEKADFKARAEAVGLDENASLTDVVAAETTKMNELAKSQSEKMADLKAKNHKLWMLLQHVNKVFADRAKTSMPGVTETELKAAVGKIGSSAGMVVKYTNDDKTLGYVEFEELGTSIRCPEEGEFVFGVDFAKLNAELAEKNQA